MLVRLFSKEDSHNKYPFLQGTIQYMCPDVVLVPPTGYGPAVCDLQNKISLFDQLNLG